MKSEDIINTLNYVILKDLVSDNSTIKDVMKGFITGGWKGWLHVEYAKRVLEQGTYVSVQEARYPNGQHCDIFFNTEHENNTVLSGTPIWIELETQKSAAHTNAAVDFLEDINKMLVVAELPAIMPDGTICRFKDMNIMIVIAIFVGYNAKNNKLLREISLQQGDKVKYKVLNTVEQRWDDATTTITANETFPLVAIFRI